MKIFDEEKKIYLFFIKIIVKIVKFYIYHKISRIFRFLILQY